MSLDVVATVVPVHPDATQRTVRQTRNGPIHLKKNYTNSCAGDGCGQAHIHPYACSHLDCHVAASVHVVEDAIGGLVAYATDVHDSL